MAAKAGLSFGSCAQQQSTRPKNAAGQSPPSSSPPASSSSEFPTPKGLHRRGGGRGRRSPRWATATITWGAAQPSYGTCSRGRGHFSASRCGRTPRLGMPCDAMRPTGGAVYAKRSAHLAGGKLPADDREAVDVHRCPVPQTLSCCRVLVAAGRRCQGGGGHHLWSHPVVGAHHRRQVRVHARRPAQPEVRDLEGGGREHRRK